MSPLRESARLRQSWESNAEAWSEAVRDGAIESRAVTDRALLSVLERLAPRRVLDLGCGEGWLVRRLTAGGLDALGVDGSAGLIEKAESLGGGRYRRISYAELSEGGKGLDGGFDCIVANFALLEEDLAPLLQACSGLLAAEGRLVIQTLHPWSQAEPFRDGWREEDFRGLASGRWQPMPWYFRSLSSWIALLADQGFLLSGLEEPCHPASGKALSLLLLAETRLSKGRLPSKS